MGEGEKVGIGDSDHEIDSGVGEGFEDLNVGIVDSDGIDVLVFDEFYGFIRCREIVGVSSIANPNFASIADSF